MNQSSIKIDSHEVLASTLWYHILLQRCQNKQYIISQKRVVSFKWQVVKYWLITLFWSTIMRKIDLFLWCQLYFHFHHKPSLLLNIWLWSDRNAIYLVYCSSKQMAADLNWCDFYICKSENCVRKSKSGIAILHSMKKVWLIDKYCRSWNQLSISCFPLFHRERHSKVTRETLLLFLLFAERYIQNRPKIVTDTFVNHCCIISKKLVYALENQTIKF